MRCWRRASRSWKPPDLLACAPLTHLTGEQAAKIAREFLLGEAAQKEPDPTNEYFQLTMLEQLDTDETKPIWMLACVTACGTHWSDSTEPSTRGHQATHTKAESRHLLNIAARSHRNRLNIMALPRGFEPLFPP